jgi:hypothetical protein
MNTKDFKIRVTNKPIISLYFDSDDIINIIERGVYRKDKFCIFEPKYKRYIELEKEDTAVGAYEFFNQLSNFKIIKI